MKSALMGEADKASPCPFIESVGGMCRIVHENVVSDVDEFERVIGEARDAELADDHVAAMRSYERLSEIYRADLLPGDIYDDWFATTREHYRVEFVDAMVRASYRHMERDEPTAALQFVRRALATDPLREDLYQLALRCQLLAGQRSAAIETFLQCRSRLAEELGLDPSAETRALYNEVLAMEERPRVGYREDVDLLDDGI
jgi:DNA-binding SARP family transcriptional activator